MVNNGIISEANQGDVPYVAKTLPSKPTNTDTVVVGQPPPFSNTVKTSLADTFSGAI